MLKMTRNKKTTKALKVTDCDGNFEIFNSVEDAAKYMEVAKQSIYQAISSHKQLRGCTIERI